MGSFWITGIIMDLIIPLVVLAFLFLGAGAIAVGFVNYQDRKEQEKQSKTSDKSKS